MTDEEKNEERDDRTRQIGALDQVRSWTSGLAQMVADYYEVLIGTGVRQSFAEKLTADFQARLLGRAFEIPEEGPYYGD